MLLFINANFGKSLYYRLLWFSDLGYASVFPRILGSRVLIFVIAAFFFCLLFLGNIYLALRLLPKISSSPWPWAIVSKIQPVLRSGILIAAAILSLLFGLIAQGSWESILLALNWQPFGITDPAFNREVGFYVFSLPFLNLLRGWLTGAFIISLLGTAAVYFTGYSVQRLKFNFPRRVTGHLGGILIAVLGLFAWGYWLGIWELVFSRQGIIFGAGYADMHAKLPAQWILMGIVLLFVVIILVSVFPAALPLVLYGLGAWIIAAILIGTVYPGGHSALPGTAERTRPRNPLHR